jgi:integrase
VPAEQRGSAYRLKTKGKWGVRWREHGRLFHQSPFGSKTEALNYYRDEVAPRLTGRGSDGRRITFREFVTTYLTAHSANVEASTIQTLRERLGVPPEAKGPRQPGDVSTPKPPWRASRRKHKTAIEAFGDLTLRELENAAAEVAAWRALLPEGSRYGTTQALRQVFNAAVEWEYMAKNPARKAGRNPQPIREEIEVFESETEIDRLADELDEWGAIPIFGSETGLRPCEWLALERRDISRNDGIALVQRSYTERGGLKLYGKTARARRPVPLSDRALAAIDFYSPPRLGTRLVFPACGGGGGRRRGAYGYLNLANWRRREWYPALESAGLPRHDIYVLRHTFATWALTRPPELEIFELARYMGDSVRTIERYYGHLAKGATARARAKFNARAGRSVSANPAEPETA